MSDLPCGRQHVPDIAAGGCLAIIILPKEFVKRAPNGRPPQLLQTLSVANQKVKKKHGSMLSRGLGIWCSYRLPAPGYWLLAAFAARPRTCRVFVPIRIGVEPYLTPDSIPPVRPGQGDFLCPLPFALFWYLSRITRITRIRRESSVAQRVAAVPTPSLC